MFRKFFYLALALFISACGLLPPKLISIEPTHQVGNMTENAIEPILSAKVEADISSGLPNPSWDLTESGILTLNQALGDLHSTPSASIFDGLGYRGFLLNANTSHGELLIQVQNGYVIITKKESKDIYLDINKQFEKWLLLSGRPHLDVDTYSFIEESIGK